MKLTAGTTLALLLALCMSFTAQQAQGDDASGKKKELERIKREMRDKKREIKRADKKERSVLADMEKIDKAIQSGGAELAAQQKRLKDAEAALRDVEKSNATLNQGMGRLKSIYKQRVRALYKAGRLGYAAAMLSSDSVSGALKRAKYLGIIVVTDLKVIRDYKDTLALLSVRQSALKNAKDEIVRRRQMVESKKAELFEQRQKKSELLSDVRKKKDLYEQSLTELEESSAALWAMIKKAEQEMKAAKKAAHAARQGSPAAVSQAVGRLPWPVEGQIVTRFGMQRHPKFGTMVFRRGIEIEARPGEQVHAVADGQVAYADWCKGYGKLMILDHGSGFYTLYGHLFSLGLSKGDRVLKGQALGLVGDTGGIKETRLYFEIRRNGEAQDPLNLLAMR